MSRLPETEVIRKDLEREIVGRRVKDVTVRTAALVGRHRTRPEFAKALVGHRIEAVSRKGVHLVLDLDGDAALVIRLGENGSLSRETANAEGGRHTQLIATFTTGGALHYVDPVPDGEMFVLPRDELAELPELAKAGVDPLADIFTWRAFGEQLRRRATPLKALLVDPTFVVGLGDRYSDEVLWSAGLSGARNSAKLSSQEVRRLYRAVLEVLHESVKRLGADGGVTPVSEDDDGDEDDEPVAWLHVWGREGLPCARCRRPIRHTAVVDGHASYHCPDCQT